MKKLAILLLASACSPFAPDLGGAPYLCNDTAPRCPDGYTCMETGQAAEDKICISNNGAALDGAGFACNDDSPLEGANRNDDIQHAFVTPVDSPKTDWPLTMLAICPAGDKDTYAINLTMTNKGIKVTTAWPGGEAVTAIILGSNGNPISTSEPDGATGSKSCATNLPTGSYFVQASAAPGVQNNYDMHVTIVDNCL